MCTSSKWDQSHASSWHNVLKNGSGHCPIFLIWMAHIARADSSMWLRLTYMRNVCAPVNTFASRAWSSWVKWTKSNITVTPWSCQWLSALRCFLRCCYLALRASSNGGESCWPVSLPQCTICSVHLLHRIKLPFLERVRHRKRDSTHLGIYSFLVMFDNFISAGKVDQTQKWYRWKGRIPNKPSQIIQQFGSSLQNGLWTAKNIRCPTAQYCGTK